MSLSVSDKTQREQLEQQLDSLAQELYGQHRQMVPMFPYVLVRVLKREQVKNGVICPDIDQNKTIHEGIVLATWQPTTKEIGRVRENGERMTRVVLHKSQLNRGAHVLFPHWAGLPVVGMSEERYRLIKETGWHESQEGGIIAEVGYDDEESKPSKMLEQMASDLIFESVNDPHTATTTQLAAAFVHKVQDQFLLVDKDKPSMTLSGV